MDKVSGLCLSKVSGSGVVVVVPDDLQSEGFLVRYISAALVMEQSIPFPWVQFTGCGVLSSFSLMAWVNASIFEASAMASLSPCQSRTSVISHHMGPRLAAQVGTGWVTVVLLQKLVAH